VYRQILISYHFIFIKAAQYTFTAFRIDVMQRRQTAPVAAFANSAKSQSESQPKDYMNCNASQQMASTNDTAEVRASGYANFIVCADSNLVNFREFSEGKVEWRKRSAQHGAMVEREAERRSVECLRTLVVGRFHTLHHV
jgi:hypothetical protein